MPTLNPDDPAAALSGAFSTDSATPDVDGLVGDGGPAFDPAAQPAPVPIDPAALAGGPTWNQSRVRAILTAQGELLHSTAAVHPDSDEWRYTAADLQAIAGPLARILNRYDVTRAAAGSGDEMAVAMGFAGYGVRSWSERRRLLAELRAADPGAYADDDQAADVAPAPAPEPEYPDDGDLPPIAPRR